LVKSASQGSHLILMPVSKRGAGRYSQGENT
jgi:hypothetical protein